MTDQKPNRLPRKVRRLGLAVIATLALVIGLASPAWANFPHFKSSSVSLASGTSAAATRSTTSNASTSGQLPALLFTWTEVGLGSTDVTYTLSTTVTATFGCANKAGQIPSASNKRTVTAPITTTVELPTTKNGQVTGSVVLPTASVTPTGFACPSGQTLIALSATFSDNTITDTTNGVTVTDEDISVTLWP